MIWNMRAAKSCRTAAAMALALALSACSGGGNTFDNGADSSTQTSAKSTAPADPLSFSASNYSIAQSAGSVTLTVIRSGTASAAVSIDYTTVDGTAFAGTDYTATTGSLQWAENDSTPKKIVVPISNATPYSGDKKFQVVLSNPGVGAQIGNPDSAAVTISGDATAAAGRLHFSASIYAVAQSIRTMTVTVNRAEGSSGEVSVAYATSNGTAVAGADYTAASGVLHWADGDATSKTFTVAISNAAPFSGTKSFGIVLSNPLSGATLGIPSSATVTIKGDSSPPAGSLTFSTSSYTVAQNAGTVAVTVERTDGSTGDVSVAYATSNGTAVSGTDFTAVNGTLNWASGDTTAKTFTIAISNASPFSGNKTFTVVLSNPSRWATIGNPASASVTISGDAVPPVGSLRFSAASYTVSQSAGTVTVTVVRNGGSSGAVSVAYATANGTAVAGTDYTAAKGTLKWADGDASAKTFEVAISNAVPFSGSKSFSVALSAPSGGQSAPNGGATLSNPSSASVSISGDAGAAVGSLQLSNSSYTVAQSAGTLTVTVNRTGGSAGAVSVAYATANGTAVAGTDYTAAKGSLDWAAGDATSKTFSVEISNATPFSGSKSFSVTLSSPSGGATLSTPSSASVTVIGDGSSGPAPGGATAVAWPYTALVSFTPPAAIEGKTVTAYTVTATNAAWIAGSAPASPVMVQGGNPGWGGAKSAFTVTATYSDGTTSPASAASNAVVPTAGSGPSTSPNVYVNGVFYWEGDYSYGGAVSYADATGDPESNAAGPGPYDVMFTSTGGGWQPYSPTNSYDLTGYRYLQIDLKPTTSGKTWIVYFEKVGDIPAGGQVTLPSDANGTYGPAPVVGQWATYKIPLVNMNVGPGTSNVNIYKFAVRDGAAIGTNVWYANNAKFTAN